MALVATAGSAGAAPSVTEYNTNLTANSTLEEIVAGADGNLWFTEYASPGQIGRITPAGGITEFGQSHGLSTNGKPNGITKGPDGNVWFTEFGNPGRVGKVTPAGAISEFTGGSTTNFTANRNPSEITTGPDGNLWFTEYSNPGAIVRITPAGAVTEFKAGVVPGFTANSGPYGITTGPDGNLWFTEANNPDAIGRMTPSGNVTEFSTHLSQMSQPLEIARGPDGNLWFTEYNDPGRVGKITPSGAITEFTGGVKPGFTANKSPSYIVAGPDGNLWFTEYSNPGAIVRITPAGAVTEFKAGVVPGFTANSGPYGITVGPDGNLWFVEFNDPGAVGRMTTPPAVVTGGASVLGSRAASVKGTVNGHAQNTSYRFEYGLTKAYGAATAPVGIGSGFAGVAATRTLAGLKPKTTYHYRLDATNPTGTANGADRTFTTPPLPVLKAVKVEPSTWRRGSKLPGVFKAKKQAPVGTKITFKLNRAVPVRLRFFLTKPGRKVNKKCQPLTHTNAGAKKCTRLIFAGSISLTGHAGKNTVRFQGRISKTKTLQPGPYVLKATTADPTTPKNSTRTARFRIVKG